jgi:hypothetical protein
MSNRFQRRRDVARARQELSGACLVTYMLPVGEPLKEALLRDAVSWWLASRKQRRPHCPVCRSNFADEASPGAFLLSTPVMAATAASVTCFCAECVRLPPEEIERHCVRVLRHLLPGGKFLDPASP